MRKEQQKLQSKIKGKLGISNNSHKKTHLIGANVTCNFKKSFVVKKKKEKKCEFIVNSTAQK